VNPRTWTSAGEHILTISWRRKFESKVHDDNYLRVERAYGSFSRSFSLANSVNAEAIKADIRMRADAEAYRSAKKAKPSRSKVN